MTIKARLARLESRLDRARPADPFPWATDADLDRIIESMGGSDVLREIVSEHPEHREALAPDIAAHEAREATTPRWWPVGPPGQKRWQHGVRRRTEDGGWRIT